MRAKGRISNSYKHDGPFSRGIYVFSIYDLGTGCVVDLPVLSSFSIHLITEHLLVLNDTCYY